MATMFSTLSHLGDKDGAEVYGGTFSNGVLVYVEYTAESDYVEVSAEYTGEEKTQTVLMDAFTYNSDEVSLGDAVEETLKDISMWDMETVSE